jgi:SAM-dependent methyltransferase
MRFCVILESSEDQNILASASKTAPNRGVIHPFDRKYGTDTGGYLGPEELVKGRENDALNHGYSAIAPSVFHEAYKRWRETLHAVSGRVEAYSFVDVGAGKGRALLLAAELPFRKVIGVELSEELSHIAQKNVVRWNRVIRPKSKIRAIQGDAAKFRWPRTPLLVYLYNPFACTLVAQMAEKLAAAAASGSGLVDLIYVNPTCTDTLTSRGLFVHLWTARIPMDEADQMADPYGTTSDLVSAYRLK